MSAFSSYPALSIPSPSESIGKALEVKSLLQDQQIKKQQLQLQQQKVADEKATTAAMKDADPSKPTYFDDVADAIVKKYGGSAAAAQAWQQHGFQIKKTFSDIAMQDANTGSKNLETYNGKNKAVGDSLGVLTDPKQVPDDQLHDQALKHVADLQQNGILDAPHAQQLTQQIQATTDPAALRSNLQMAANSFKGQKAIADEAAKSAELAKTQAETEKADWSNFENLGVQVNNKTGEVRNVSGQAMTPAMIESKYLSLQQAKNQGVKLSPPDQAWAKAYEHMKTLSPAYTFALQNGGANGAGGQPSTLAQAIANGQMKWSEAISPRTPQSVKNSTMAEVLKLKPDFDTAEFGLETAAAQKARSGAWADTRVAYNTAIDHSRQLLDTIDALSNGDTQKLNSLKNFFKTQFGSPDVPTYQAVANAYNHEVTSVVSKGHITDKEVETGGSVLPANASPQQLRSVVNAYNGLMKSKRDELDKVIKAGAGNKADKTLGVQSGGEGGAPGAHKVGDVIVQGGKKFKATAVDANGKVTAADPL